MTIIEYRLIMGFINDFSRIQKIQVPRFAIDTWFYFTLFYAYRGKVNVKRKLNLPTRRDAHKYERNRKCHVRNLRYDYGDQSYIG